MRRSIHCLQRLHPHRCEKEELGFGATGIVLRKAVCGKVRSPDEAPHDVKDRTMSSSPVTPTPPPPTSRMMMDRREYDIGSLVKQQQIARELPLPPLSASQIAHCENALRQLKAKAKGNGGRNTNGAIDCEFDNLQVERMHNYKAYSQTAVALAPSNKGKNRYVDVLPYDSTRVVLTKRYSSSDYINASFVQDNVHEYLPRYISTQGPLVNTVTDFWAMVLEQRCPVIVMLTRIVDGYQDKCAHYFPRDENQSQTHGYIFVTNKSLICSPHGIARRVFTVQDTKAPGQPWTVVHYEYLGWPDHYVPPTTRSVRELVRATFTIPPQAGPFVVHCSAGIGRTGTFCVIDHTIRRLLEGDLTAVDVENTVRQFRLQRDGMVQTREQYRFVYEAIIHELEDYINTAKR